MSGSGTTLGLSPDIVAACLALEAARDHAEEFLKVARTRGCDPLGGAARIGATAGEGLAAVGAVIPGLAVVSIRCRV